MTNTPKIIVEHVAAGGLSPAQKDELWQCYSKFVDGSRDRFLQNLADADEVFVCREKTSGRVRGFEANKILHIRQNGRSNVVIFTFYADLEPEFRGSNILQRIFVRRFVSLRLRHPFSRLSWMFTASTYTSYLLMPRNFADYWPRRDRATPLSVRTFMDRVMRRIGSEGWDRRAAVLRRHGSQRYREGIVADDRRVLDDPDIRFYADMNPGQHLGDSLACHCPLTARNFLSVLEHVLRRVVRCRRRHLVGAWNRMLGPRGGKLIAPWARR